MLTDRLGQLGVDDGHGTSLPRGPDRLTNIAGSADIQPRIRGKKSGARKSAALPVPLRSFNDVENPSVASQRRVNLQFHLNAPVDGVTSSDHVGLRVSARRTQFRLLSSQFFTLLRALPLRVAPNLLIRHLLQELAPGPAERLLFPCHALIHSHGRRSLAARAAIRRPSDAHTRWQSGGFRNRHQGMGSVAAELGLDQQLDLGLVEVIRQDELHRAQVAPDEAVR